jgi:hypothetical protein
MHLATECQAFCSVVTSELGPPSGPLSFTRKRMLLWPPLGPMGDPGETQSLAGEGLAEPSFYEATNNLEPQIAELTRRPP